jgi:molybdopterin/thiamine biosynthesis adenylyltransferase
MTSQRFDRQLGMPGIGAAEQARLRRSSVLVAGIGGVGGAAATYLAAAGVGRLVLVHPGELEEPDLNRQTLMLPDDVGHSRVEAASRTLRRHYPDVDVVAHDCPIDDPRLPGLIADADVVVDARHNFPERYRLNRLCRAAGVPEVVSAMDGAQLQLMTSLPGGPCWRCLFPVGDAQWQPLGFRVLGAVAGAAGTLAAAEVVKLVTGAGTPLGSRLLFGDLWSMEFRTVGVQRRAGCPDCDPAITMPAGEDGVRPCGGMCGCGHSHGGRGHGSADGKSHAVQVLTMGRSSCEPDGR